MVVCGFSMGRMGPAFSRSKIGYPLALFGLALAFFSPDNGLKHTQSYVVLGNSRLSWVLYIIQRGANLQCDQARTPVGRLVNCGDLLVCHAEVF